jgi:hypothetical protein
MKYIIINVLLVLFITQANAQKKGIKWHLGFGVNTNASYIDSKNDNFVPNLNPAQTHFSDNELCNFRVVKKDYIKPESWGFSNHLTYNLTPRIDLINSIGYQQYREHYYYFLSGPYVEYFAKNTYAASSRLHYLSFRNSIAYSVVTIKKLELKAFATLEQQYLYSYLDKEDKKLVNIDTTFISVINQNSNSSFTQLSGDISTSGSHENKEYKRYNMNAIIGVGLKYTISKKISIMLNQSIGYGVVNMLNKKSEHRFRRFDYRDNIIYPMNKLHLYNTSTELSISFRLQRK